MTKYENGALIFEIDRGSMHLSLHQTVHNCSLIASDSSTDEAVNLDLCRENLVDIYYSLGNYLYGTN